MAAPDFSHSVEAVSYKRQGVRVGKDPEAGGLLWSCVLADRLEALAPCSSKYYNNVW